MLHVMQFFNIHITFINLFNNLIFRRSLVLVLFTTLQLSHKVRWNKFNKTNRCGPRRSGEGRSKGAREDLLRHYAMLKRN